MFPDSIKERFNLPPTIHFLNCATRGPFTRAVEQAGIAVIQDFTPVIHQIKPDHFFEQAWVVRKLFSDLIHNPDPQRIAVVPSVSYAMAIMARNLHRKKGIKAGQHILMISEEFPSDVYAWERVCQELSLTIKTIQKPKIENVASDWNAQILENINSETALVVLPHVHWQHGTKFDLENISKRCKEIGALFAIDGTQSVGAMDLDIEKIKPDLMVVAAYKWLMGPYSTGLVYLGEFFDDGIPIEETWMGRLESNQFHKLTDYQAVYQPKAYRYNMGQHSQFIQMPMLETAIREKLEWGVNNIQAHCRELWQKPIQQLSKLGVKFGNEQNRAYHLVGLELPEGTDGMRVIEKLAERKVIVVARGTSIRVSPNIYNTEADMEALVAAFCEMIN